MTALRLLIDGDALAANWRRLADLSGPAACGAAVKADGYGLGARGVVARLAAAGCRDFFVATWDEAAALGPLPAGARLSVLHGVRAEDMAAAEAAPHRPVLNTAAQAARWRGTGRPCDVMVDTGMNRLGLSPEEATSGLLDGLAIDTLMSHLACADEPGHPLNEAQRAAFAGVAARVPAARYSLANSAGILLGDGYAFGLNRPGLGLYGGLPGPGARVVRVEAQVLQRRTLPAGATIGYGASWRAAADAEVAILNLGYADGYLRAFSDPAPADGRPGGGLAFSSPDRSLRAQARPEVEKPVLDGRVSTGSTLREPSGGANGGQPCPVIGRVSMDLTAVAVPAHVAEGDWLEVDYDLARWSAVTGLSQYELLTGLGRRYERRWT